MTGSARKLRILLVDDSEDDILLARMVFKQLPHCLETMDDPLQVMDYLRCCGQHSGRRRELPDLVLLDVNMPRMGGIDLLKAIKADSALKQLPVIMFTTSSARADISRSYEHGAASYITKPDSFDGYKQLMQNFGQYWLSVSNLPL